MKDHDLQDSLNTVRWEIRLCQDYMQNVNNAAEREAWESKLRELNRKQIRLSAQIKGIQP